MQPSEPHRSFPDHYSDQAEAYAAHRPGYPGSLVDVLAELPEKAGTAWEAGCGSGQLSVPLARRFERVLATDASAGQVAQGRPHPRVEYRCAPAHASGLPPGSADLAVAAQAAHWFDLDAYYREVRRVARPGGAVALVSYGTPSMEGAVGTLLRRFYEEVLGPWWPEERRHVEEGYHALPFPFPTLETPELRMEEVWPRSRVLGYVGTWSAVRALEEAEGPGAFQAFVAAVREAWPDGADARTIRWPLSVRAGRVG